MTVLRSLSRRTRVLLLALNLAAVTVVLANWWLAIWPNLAASWAQGSVLVALAAPLGAWVTRLLDRHHERATVHLDREHAVTRELLAALSGQVAALHARLDQQAGGEP